MTQDQPDFGNFQPIPPSADKSPAPPAEKRTRGPRRDPRAAKNKPGRPRKADVMPDRPPVDLPKIVAAVAGLDQVEAKLVVDMASALNVVTPFQAVRIACALGKLFS